VRCALEISRTMQGHPHIQLRMGVHSGPVNQVTDVNDEPSIAGPGINMAQCVMDCGDAGHILLSKRVAEDLGQYRHWQPYLHDLGDCQVKHDVTVSVVNLYTDEAGNSALPAKFAISQREKLSPGPARAVASGRSKSWMIGLAALVTFVVFGAILFFARHEPAKTTNTSDSTAPDSAAANARIATPAPPI